MKTDFSKSPIIVLGMHRSATSLVARSLHKEGVSMGDDFLFNNAENNGGHYEDVRFYNLNEMILKEAGGSWWSPPPEEDIIRAGKKLSEEIKRTIESAVKPKWGWKDPRTVLTIKCYMEYLEDPFFVICMRKPIEVAESLYEHYGVELNRGISIAREYNRRLFDFMIYLGYKYD